MAEAARRLAAQGPAAKPSTDSMPPMEARWCEWPRRAASGMRRPGIWQALREIQTRHA